MGKGLGSGRLGLHNDLFSAPTSTEPPTSASPAQTVEQPLLTTSVRDGLVLLGN